MKDALAEILATNDARATALAEKFRTDCGVPSDIGVAVCIYHREGRVVTIGNAGGTEREAAFALHKAADRLDPQSKASTG